MAISEPTVDKPKEINLGIDGLGPAVHLGAGGSANVFAAARLDTGEHVAVKLLRASADSEKERTRFLREQETLERLAGDAGIVPILDSGVTDRHEPYLLMPLMAGSLQDRIETEGGVDWQTAAQLMADVADSVEHAHEQSVLHRDLKPGNILVDHNGVPRVADFGIAKMMDSSVSKSSKSLGTPSFMPPERLNGHEATERSDVYGLGATLAALVTGTPPFITGANDTDAAIMMRVVTEQPPELDETHAPEALSALVTQSMAKEPLERPESAREFATRLRTLLPLNADTSATTGPLTIVVPKRDITIPVAPLPTENNNDRKLPKLLPLALAAAIILIAGVAGAFALTGGNDTSTIASNGTTTPEDNEPETTNQTGDENGSGDTQNTENDDELDAQVASATQTNGASNSTDDPTNTESGETGSTNTSNGTDTGDGTNTETNAGTGTNTAGNDTGTNTGAGTDTGQTIPSTGINTGGTGGGTDTGTNTGGGTDTGDNTAGGNTDTNTDTGTGGATNEVAPPDACFSFSPSNPEVGDSVRFFSSCTSGSPTSHSWTFGDGDTSTSTTPSHTFDRSGSFTVRLTARNNGGSDTTTRTITINPQEVVPPTTPEPPEEPPEFEQRIDIGDIGETNVRFRFTSSVTTGYTVRVTTGGTNVATQSGSATGGVLENVTISGLTPGTDYSVSVTLNGSSSVTSSPVAFRTPGGDAAPAVDPVAVLNLRVASTESTRFQVNYESNVCANGSFVITDSSGTIVGSNAGQADGCTTRHLGIPGFWTPALQPNTTYTITVTVEANGRGQGGGNTASQSLTVTTAG